MITEQNRRCAINYLNELKASTSGYAVEWLDIAIKTLEQQPNRCDSCIHSEEQDGSNCYECVKGMADNFETQQTEMRDATEEERKSVRDYIRSISKPTGVQFETQPTDVDCISRTELLSRIDAERKHLLELKMDGAEHIIVHHARRIIEDMPSVIPKAVSEEVKADDT